MLTKFSKHTYYLFVVLLYYTMFNMYLSSTKIPPISGGIFNIYFGVSRIVAIGLRIVHSTLLDLRAIEDKIHNRRKEYQDNQDSNPTPRHVLE